MEGMFKGIKEEENEDEDEEEDYGLNQLRNGVVNFVTPSGKRDKKRGRTTLNERTEVGNEGEAVPEEVPSSINVSRTTSFDGQGEIGRAHV